MSAITGVIDADAWIVDGKGVITNRVRRKLGDHLQWRDNGEFHEGIIREFIPEETAARVEMRDGRIVKVGSRKVL